MELTAKELAAFTRAQDQGYVVVEPGQRNLDQTYYDYCVSNQLSWIKVIIHPPECNECHISEEHATVWYDLFHLRHALTSEAFQRIKESFDRTRPGNYKKSGVNIGKAGGNAIVPEYAAVKIAKTLSELLNDTNSHSTEIFTTVYPQ